MLICAPFLEYTEEKRRLKNTEIVCIDAVVQDLINSIENRGEGAFFDKYSAPAHLVICDVECLAGKMKTQEEIEKLVEKRNDAGKVTTFLVSVTVDRVKEALNLKLFAAITRDGTVDRYK